MSLKKAGEPLHRDEIVKRVLKSRQVKETTILTEPAEQSHSSSAFQKQPTN